MVVLVVVVVVVLVVVVVVEAGAVTCTVRRFVAESPSASVTVRSTALVPCSEKVWETRAPVSVDPSGKTHL